MTRMFRSATSFNGDLSSWDVSKVTDMSNMFQSATSFNQPLSSWDVSKVTDMAEHVPSSPPPSTSPSTPGTSPRQLT